MHSRFRSYFLKNPIAIVTYRGEKKNSKKALSADNI